MGLTVRQWRRAKEITQESMANYLGVHVNTIINWEKEPEKIPIHCAKKMADFLGVSLSDISFETEES